MARLLLIFLLFILPFFVFPFSIHQFEPPKVILAEVVVVALTLISLLKKKKSFFGPDLLGFSILGGIFVLTLVQLLGNSTALAFFGNEFRLQGVFLLWCLMLFSLSSHHFDLPKVPHYFYLIILGTMLALALFIGNPLGRAVGTIGEPNALAAFAVFVWPFYILNKDLPKRQARYLIGACIILALSIIFISFSTSGLVAFAIQLFLVFVLFKLKTSVKKAVILAFILFVLVHILPFFETSIYENRLDVWRASLTAGFSNPIFGVGFGNTEVAIRETSIATHNQLVEYYVDSGHNIFLDWWIQGGVAGLGLFSLLIFKTIRSFILKDEKKNLILLFGVLTAVSFNPASVVSLLALWWLIGQGFDNKKA